MKRRLLVILTIVFAVILSGCGEAGTAYDSTSDGSNADRDKASSSDVTEAEVKEALETLRVAVEKGDQEGLSNIYADDYMIVSPEGKAETKAQRMDALKAGTVKYEKVEFTDPKIRTYGNVAVVVTGAGGKAMVEGKETELDMLATIVFVKSEDGIREVSAHLTNKAEE